MLRPHGARQRRLGGSVPGTLNFSFFSGCLELIPGLSPLQYGEDSIDVSKSAHLEKFGFLGFNSQRTPFSLPCLPCSGSHWYAWLFVGVALLKKLNTEDAVRVKTLDLNSADQ